ncbi:MAG: hypothetical protein ACNA7Z_05345 [Dethiobacteria bacterium]
MCFGVLTDENSDGSGSTTESMVRVKPPEPIITDNNESDQNVVVSNCDADRIAGDSVFFVSEANSDDPGTAGEYYKVQDNQENLPTDTPVNEGTGSDLAKAVEVFEQALQLFEANSSLFAANESTLVRIELAVAKAAIYALELKLSADLRLIEKTADAYAEALTVLSELGGYLSEDQLALVAELLNAVDEVLSEYAIIATSILP